MNLEFSQQIFEKSANTKFHDNPSSGSGFVPCGLTDRRIDMTKLTVAFRNFAKSAEKCLFFWSLVHVLFRHSLTNITLLSAFQKKREIILQHFFLNQIVGFLEVTEQLIYCCIVLFSSSGD